MSYARMEVDFSSLIRVLSRDSVYFSLFWREQETLELGTKDNACHRSTCLAFRAPGSRDQNLVAVGHILLIQ